MQVKFIMDKATESARKIKAIIEEVSHHKFPYLIDDEHEAQAMYSKIAQALRKAGFEAEANRFETIAGQEEYHGSRLSAIDSNAK